MTEGFVSVMGPVFEWRNVVEYFTPIATSNPAGVVSKLFVATPALFTATIVRHHVVITKSRSTNRGYPDCPLLV